MIMARFLEDNNYIKLRAVITNLRPEKERARLMRGTLDLLGMQHVPVGIGTDGNKKNRWYYYYYFLLPLGHPAPPPPQALVALL
jgi:hypothetical protein